MTIDREPSAVPYGTVDWLRLGPAHRATKPRLGDRGAIEIHIIVVAAVLLVGFVVVPATLNFVGTLLVKDAEGEIRGRWRDVDAVALAGLLDYDSTGREPNEFPAVPGYAHFHRAEVARDRSVVVLYDVSRLLTDVCIVVRVRGPRPSRVDAERHNRSCAEMARKGIVERSDR